MNIWILFFSFLGFVLFEGRRIIDDFSKNGGAAQVFRSQIWYWMCIAASAFSVSILSSLLSANDFNQSVWPFVNHSPVISECIRAIILGYCAIPIMKSKNMKSVPSSVSGFGIDDTPPPFSGKIRWWLNR